MIKNIIIITAFLFIALTIGTTKAKSEMTPNENMKEEETNADVDNFQADKTRLSFLGDVGLNTHHAHETLGYVLEAGVNFNTFWAEAFYGSTKTNFHMASQNADYTSNNTYAETNHKRKENSSLLITSYGGGIGYRHFFPVELSFTKQLFHQAIFYVTYNSVKDGLNKDGYQGPGMKAQYGISKRFATNMAFGAQFAYHLAQVKRAEAFAGETSTDRRLLLSWITLGLDLSFYF